MAAGSPRPNDEHQNRAFPLLVELDPTLDETEASCLAGNTQALWSLTQETPAYSLTVGDVIYRFSRNLQAARPGFQ